MKLRNIRQFSIWKKQMLLICRIQSGALKIYFVRDDKKRNYYLITMKGNKRVDLKAFRRQRGLRALSFAAAEELFDIMKLIPVPLRRLVF